MPTSPRKRRIVHADYATEQRMKRLEQEVDTFLEDFFEDHLNDPYFPMNDEGKKQDPFEVEIDHKLKSEADYTGDELSHVANEHQFRHKKIQGLANKHFGQDVAQSFTSDEVDQDHMTFIHITISELPRVARDSEHAFPKQMRKDLVKELKEFVVDEVGDDILGIKVKLYTGKGKKDIGEYYFTGEKIAADYDHVHVIVAFKWKHKPIFQQQSGGGDRDQKRAARRSALYMHRSEDEMTASLDHVSDAIEHLADQGMLSSGDVLGMVWDKLD